MDNTITADDLRSTARAICAGLPVDELHSHPAWRAADRIEALEHELQCACDHGMDLVTGVELLREALGVPAEPHQGILERLVKRAESLNRSEVQMIGDLALRFDQEGDALLKSEKPDDKARGRSRKTAACSLAVEATRIHQQGVACPGCGSVPGLYHSPECPSVNAFTAGRIPYPAASSTACDDQLAPDPSFKGAAQ